jgi:hypothetical protein
MGNVGSDGESFMCPFCTDKVKMGVSSSPAQGDCKKLANLSNYSHSAPGAQCLVVPSAPKPCQPSAQPIDPGQSPLFVDGKSALGAGCKFMCSNGGLLTVSSSAQSSAIHDGAGGAAAAPSPTILTPPIESTDSANDEDEDQPPKKAKFKKGNRDGKSAKQRSRENRKRDGTPGNNKAQNAGFNGAVNKIEKQIGRKLSKKDVRRLHDHISKQNYDYHGIVDEGTAMFGD